MTGWFFDVADTAEDALKMGAFGGGAAELAGSKLDGSTNEVVAGIVA